MMESRDDVCANIRACLNSTSRQISIGELEKDYKSIIGTNIPFRNLGYSSLENFVKSIKNIKVSCIGNNVYVDIKPDEKTAHITKLVTGQRVAKKKKNKGKYLPDYRSVPPNRRFKRPPTPHSRPSDTKSWNSNNRSTYYHRENTYNPEDPKYLTYKYRTSSPCCYNFSNDEDTEDDYNDASLSDEPVAPSVRDESIPIIAKLDNLIVNDHISTSRNNKLCGEALSKVNDNYANLKTNHYDDDIGYSSMDGRGGRSFTAQYRRLCQTSEIIDLTSPDSRSEKSRTSHKEFRGGRSFSAHYDKNEVSTLNRNIIRDMECIQEVLISNNRNTVLPKASPATVLAAARAAAKKPSEVLDRRSSFNEPKYADDPLGTDDGKNISFKLKNTHETNNHSSKSSDRSPNLGSTTEYTANPVARKAPLPSKMMDFNMFTPGPDISPRSTPNTYCHKLFLFAIKHNLPNPEFTNFHKYDPSTKITVYICRVKIGDLPVYSSLPNESTQLSEIQEYVANVTLTNLKSKFENRNPDLLSITEDERLIIKRVTEIVSRHRSGLKREAVEIQYQSRYKEILPRNWLDVVKDLSLLSVEELVGGIFIYPSQDTQGNANVTKLPPLMLRKEDTWPVFVTSCTSTNSVFFRIVAGDDAEMFDLLTDRMEQFYSKNEDELKPVDVVKEGQYYAAYLQNQWFRVKALSAVSEEYIRVFLIDHGDAEEISRTVVYQLDESFIAIPALAIPCSLSNLENYYNNLHAVEVVYEDIIHQKALVARIDSRNPHLMVTLFDTSTDTDINLNECVRKRLEKEVSPPKVPSKNTVAHVHLTSVDENGRAFVQIISDTYKFLRSLLAMINEELANDEQLLEDERKYNAKRVADLVGGNVLLAKYDGDNLWHRVEIVQILQDDQVEVKFIDYGNIEVVPMNKIAQTKYFPSVLGNVPPQAVEIRLVKPTGDLFTQSVIEFLMSIAQTTDKDDTMYRVMLMKVVGEGCTPDVELFVRVADSDKIVAVNNIIGTYYPNYRGSNFENLSLNMKHATRFPKIKQFVIPEGCDQISLYVHSVSNPSHFIVQPWEQRSYFLKLKEEMKIFYSMEKPIIDPDSIEIGENFAVERKNGIIRGEITTILEKTILIKCVDSNEVMSVSCNELYVLLPCFRVLPGLAIKAKLAGVKPKYCDWNVIDCVRFKELVLNKTFLGIPVDVYENSVALLLQDENGVDIEEILLEEGRAQSVI